MTVTDGQKLIVCLAPENIQISNYLYFIQKSTLCYLDEENHYITFPYQLNQNQVKVQYIMINNKNSS